MDEVVAAKSLALAFTALALTTFFNPAILLSIRSVKELINTKGFHGLVLVEGHESLRRTLFSPVPASSMEIIFALLASAIH